MTKKLQVFVSSTFTDLRDERQAAVAGVLLAGHISAGMELFTAGDEEQMSVIKRWISESDVYMLILGPRYGTVDAKSNLSYTELEYDYANELKKPSFAVVMDGDIYRDRLKSCQDAGGEKHEAFRKKVLSRISCPFLSIDQMKLGIVTALRDISERPGLIGWVKSSQIPDMQPLLTEIASLQKERDDLRSALSELPATAIEGGRLAAFDEQLIVPIQYRNNRGQNDGKVTITWGNLFALIAPKLAEFPADSILNYFVAKHLSAQLAYLGVDPRDFSVPDYEWQTVRNQFEALGLVVFQYSQSVTQSMHLYWHVTEAGRKLGVRMRAVYSDKPS